MVATSLGPNNFSHSFGGFDVQSIQLAVRVRPSFEVEISLVGDFGVANKNEFAVRRVLPYRLK